jgi:hypothetical protein
MSMEFFVKGNDDNEALEMSWYFKVTLGNLQGDQSKKQLTKCPSFIVRLRD